MIQAIVELRRQGKDGLRKANHITVLQHRGKLTRHSRRGWAAYDTKEYEEYLENAKFGRPLKNKNKNKKGVREDE